jgi:hypothetical protein
MHARESDMACLLCQEEFQEERENKRFKVFQTERGYISVIRSLKHSRESVRMLELLISVLKIIKPLYQVGAASQKIN